MTTGVFDDQDLTESSLDTPDENYIPTITSKYQFCHFITINNINVKS